MWQMCHRWMDISCTLVSRLEDLSTSWQQQSWEVAGGAGNSRQAQGPRVLLFLGSSVPSPGSVDSLTFGVTRRAGMWVRVQWCVCSAPLGPGERGRGRAPSWWAGAPAGDAAVPAGWGSGSGPAEDPPPRHWQEPALLWAQGPVQPDPGGSWVGGAGRGWGKDGRGAG